MLPGPGQRPVPQLSSPFIDLWVTVCSPGRRRTQLDWWWFIFAHHPTLPRTSEERSELTYCVRAFVFVPNSLRIRAASPLSERNDMASCILIDEDLMRQVAVKVPHVRPDLPRQPEPLCFGT